MVPTYTSRARSRTIFPTLTKQQTQTADTMPAHEEIEMEENDMDAFFNECDKIKANTAQIETDIKAISEKHGQALAAISEKQGQSMCACFLLGFLFYLLRGWWVGVGGWWFFFFFFFFWGGDITSFFH